MRRGVLCGLSGALVVGWASWSLGAEPVAAEAAATDTVAVSPAPRRPAVPEAGMDLANPIDRFLALYYGSHGGAPPGPVADGVFVRRVYLDTVGLLPTPAEQAAFLADSQPDKRERLVDDMLADNRRYAEHWLSFWNDCLRNDYRGTGYIDGGRQQITGWLYQALAQNMPYDQFVRELIDPTPDSLGFTKGIIWRGVVNASQVPEVQAAQNVSQVFMGINLKCASCHDSFINRWKLADAYGLAGIFAEGPLEMHRCDSPIGEQAPLKFLYPELGSVDAAAPRSERLKQLAAIITSPANGRLTRTMVNRLWARFLGRGLVEPVDDLDRPAWHADLLDWLASDLADNGHDLKHTMRMILTSRAYQLPAVGLGDPADGEFVFQGPQVRRMSAEQYVDAIAGLTGTPYIKADALLSPLDGEGGPAARWIWSHADAAQADAGGRIWLRKPFTLPRSAAAAALVATCDNEFALWVNGNKVAESADWSNPIAISILSHLVQGENVIAVEAINWPDPTSGKGLNIQGANPAGLVLLANVRLAEGPDGADAEAAAEETRLINSDESWLWSPPLANDHGQIPQQSPEDAAWQMAGFDTTGWKHAVELGDASLGPWGLGDRLPAALAGAPAGSVRAALVVADPFQAALGRPNREQVVTARASIATTLQALELTNGGSLADRLTRGAAAWLADPAAASAGLIDPIYQRALGREPTPDERQTAQEIVGSPPSQEGVEDLLWVLLMLPEFQLVY